MSSALIQPSIDEQSVGQRDQLALLHERVRQLETIAEVSAIAAQILVPEELFVAICELVKSKFDRYHAHIYMIDEAGQYLVLAGGAGEAGRSMKQSGWKILLSHPSSIVARAARTNTGVIVDDVTQSMDFLANPLLPNTRSEMAIPVVLKDNVIGVLDVQDDKPHKFTNSDLSLNTILARQMAVAVHNARLFAQSQVVTDQLRHVDRVKSDFLASMSHELRTPLNSIIGYSEVLIDGIDGQLTADALEDVHAIHDSGIHLLGLINDVLDLAKIEAGKMHLDFEDVELTDLFEEVSRVANGLLKDKPAVTFRGVASDVPPVRADRLRLRQILMNLISNAIKFTTKGQVTLTATVAPTENGQPDQVEIVVRDSGIGIAAEHLGMIFEQFKQVDGGAGRRRGGTGLGLPITRSLVELHGGTITVESTVGSGSTFRFNLPVFR